MTDPLAEMSIYDAMHPRWRWLFCAACGALSGTLVHFLLKW